MKPNKIQQDGGNLRNEPDEQLKKDDNDGKAYCI